MNKLFDSKKIACLDLHSPLYIRSKNTPYGGGDIGGLYDLVDKCAEAGFGIIQLNPIQDTGENPCPYTGVGIFSFNPVFLSVNELPESDELNRLKQEQIEKANNNPAVDTVDYLDLYNFKLSCLRATFDHFSELREINLSDFDTATLSYAVFVTLKNQFHSHWNDWPIEFKASGGKEILENLYVYPDLKKEIDFILYVQSTLKNQWKKISDYALSKGIVLEIDKPIYPAFDSADVWANKNLFYLKDDGSLQYESGCHNPGDSYGPQRWGHAVYKFKEDPEEVIDFFLASIEHLSHISKAIRLDHTLALIWKYYIIDPKTGNGKHLPALKFRLFSKLKESFPEIYFIAEDLGYINEKEIDRPLKKLGIPGMRCLQWIDNKKYSETKKYPFLCVAQTSNHDSPSLITWWEGLSEKEKKIIHSQYKKIKTGNEDKEIQEIISLVFNSPAKIASITLRDIIADPRRFNHPGEVNDQNWRLRSYKSLDEIDFSSIAKIIKESHRSI